MSHRRFSAWFVALVIAVTAALAPAGAAQAAARPDSYIFNNSPVGIGVWHDDDTTSVWPAVLPAYSNTWDEFGWDHSQKFYIGVGYCANVFRRPAGTGGAWSKWKALGGHSWQPVSFAYDYQVQVHREPTNAC